MSSQFISSISPLVLIGLSVALVPVHAQNYDFYVSGNVGLGTLADAETYFSGTPEDSIKLGFNNDYSLSAALGMINGQYRAEIEYSHQKNDITSFRYSGITYDLADNDVTGDVAASTGLINAYYDINIGRVLTPYVTAGIGFSKLAGEFQVVDVDDLTIGEKDTVLSYQFGAGLGYSLSEKASIDIRYRLLGTEKPDFDGVISEYLTHRVMAGFRLRF